MNPHGFRQRPTCPVSAHKTGPDSEHTNTAEGRFTPDATLHSLRQKASQLISASVKTNGITSRSSCRRNRAVPHLIITSNASFPSAESARWNTSARQEEAELIEDADNHNQRPDAAQQRVPAERPVLHWSVSRHCSSC